MFALTAGSLRAQDAATQQQIDKLAGQLQDRIESEAAQSKQLQTMEREIAELRDKVNNPAINNSASADDLQKLANEVKEIDRKRLDDRELILGKIQELARISATPTHVHHPVAAPKENSDEGGAKDAGPSQKAFPYTVQSGDSLTAIIKAFREKGVKVTLAQVLKANPGLTAKTLYVGKTIYIPDTSAQ